MKKLLYLSLTALMMLFAMPGIVRADEGDGDQTAKITVMVMNQGMEDELETDAPINVARYMALGVEAIVPGASGGGPDILAEGDEEGLRIYYTFDADVNLSHSAYLSQGDDKKIFLAEDPYDIGSYFIYTNTDEDNATLRVKAFMIQDGEEVEALTSEEVSYELPFVAVSAPEFSKPSGSELEDGTVVNIANALTGGYALYSTNNVLPTYMNQGIGAQQYVEQLGITIKGEVGSTVTVMAINYLDDDDVVAGSKLTTVTYTIKPATPPFTFNPAPSETSVPAGTEIKVTCTKGSFIYYQWFATQDAAKDVEFDEEDEEHWLTYYDPNTLPRLTAAKPVLRVVATTVMGEVVADSVVEYTVGSAPVVPDKAAAPTFDKSNGAYEAGTVVTVIMGEADSIFVATGKNVAEATSFVKATANVTVTLTADTVIRAYAMKDEKYSDTVERTYTIKVPVVDRGTLTVTPDGTSVVEEGDEVTYEVETEYEGYTVRYKWYADMATAEADNTYKNYGEGCETVGEDTKLIISKETPVLAIGVGTGVIEDEFAWVIAPKYFTYTFAGEDPEVTITLSPVSGTEVEEGDTVKITCSDETVVVHFMMFDTKANAEAISEEDWADAMIEYGEPVEDDEFIGYPVITKEKPVIKVGYAIVDEEENSTWHFTYAVYTVKGGETPVTTVAKPTFSVEAGAVEKGTKVVLACTTEGAKIYYTVNGEEPTAESTEYTAEISIDSAMTIKAIAVKEGMTNSEVAEAAYTIKSVANQTNELAGVSIYPNPTDGEFNVVAPVNAEVEIFTAAGVLVKRMVVAEGNAQVRLDNSGIYFVRVRANGQAAIRKVVVR